MVTIKWCLDQKRGLELVESNLNICDSYIGMAKESINILSKVLDSNIWSATTSYYIFYYSLYALMLRVGVKCEIHACSIQFLEEFFSKYYDQNDIDMFKKSFSVRQDLQYYTNRVVGKDDLKQVIKNCKTFLFNCTKHLD